MKKEPSRIGPWGLFYADCFSRAEVGVAYSGGTATILLPEGWSVGLKRRTEYTNFSARFYNPVV